MIDLKQDELKDWQNRNFPRSRYEELSHKELVDMVIMLQIALGVAEEAGEVCHHVLKGTQRIRGGINGVDKKEVADGVVDTLIYGTQLLSELNVNIENEAEKVIDTVLARDWTKNPTGRMMSKPVQKE